MKKKYVYLVWQRLFDDNDFDNFVDEIEGCFSNLAAAKKYAEKMVDEPYDSFFWRGKGDYYNIFFDEYTTSRFFVERKELHSKLPQYYE